MSKHGDTTKIFLEYTFDETPIEQFEDGYFADLVMQINAEGHTDALTFKLSNSTISKDNESGLYYFQLTQTQSLKLGRNIRYQLTVKVGSDVYSSDIGSMVAGELLRTSEV